MDFTKKLDFFNNIFGLLGGLYTVIIIVITFIFKENSQRILVIALPTFLLLSTIVVLIFILMDYFKKRFAEIQTIQQRIAKLEEAQSFDTRFRNIEETLIKQEHLLETMNLAHSKTSMNKRGNTYFLYFLLALLLIAFLVWYVAVLRMG